MKQDRLKEHETLRRMATADDGEALERRAREAAEKARLEATATENAPPKPMLDVSEDTLRNVLLAVAAVAAGAGLYAS